MQFLMAAISKMAHKVDLGLSVRQISQSLNSRMLHQEYAVCASGAIAVKGGGGRAALKLPSLMHAALSKHR